MTATQRLSSRQRQCLQALAKQREWPATRGDHGWSPTTPVGQWAPDTRRLLASLAALGLARDESTTTVGRPTSSPDLGVTLRARRYSITEQGEEAVRG